VTAANQFLSLFNFVNSRVGFHVETLSVGTSKEKHQQYKACVLTWQEDRLQTPGLLLVPRGLVTFVRCCDVVLLICVWSLIYSVDAGLRRLTSQLQNRARLADTSSEPETEKSQLSYMHRLHNAFLKGSMATTKKILVLNPKLYVRNALMNLLCADDELSSLVLP